MTKILLALCAAAAASASAAEWSTTELHLQVGTLDTPRFAGGGAKRTLIAGLQHASGWKYGDNFLFVDVLDAEGDGFNDFEVYGEWYTNLSLGKIRGQPVGAGPIRDVGILAGVNYGADADVLKFLPGIRLSWRVPGATFFNTDLTAYLDASEGIAGGGAPKESDSFFIEVNWGYPFQLGGSKFSFEGHVEYVGARSDELGGDVSWWILGQPQLRYHPLENLAVGFEWQFWIHKLGDPDTDESAVQALLIWRF